MSDQSDIEEKLLRKDESDGEMARSSHGSRVVGLEQPPTMTRQDFDLMREQNERILKELTRLKRKRSRSRSKSHKRSKSRDAVSDSDRSQLSDWHSGQKQNVGRSRAKKRRGDSMSDSDCSQQSDTHSRQTDAASDAEEQPAVLIKSLIQKSKKTRASSPEMSDRPKIETSAAHVLDRMQKELETNAEEGPEIDENLIKILDRIYENINQRKDNLKEKSEKICRPANWNVRVPRVNVEAWQSIDYHTKENDLMMQKRQNILLKATYKMAEMCDKCIKSSHEPMIDMFENLVDTIQLNLKAVHEISLERRKKILNSHGVNKKYKNPPFDLPVTDLLFGPDMKSFMTQCDATQKLGNNFTVSSKGRKFFPKNGYSQSHEWTQNPRGRGQHWTRPHYRGGPRGSRPSRPARGRF